MCFVFAIMKKSMSLFRVAVSDAIELQTKIARKKGTKRI